MTVDELLRNATVDVEVVVARLEIPEFGRHETGIRWRRRLALAVAGAVVIGAAVLVPVLLGSTESDPTPVVTQPSATTEPTNPTTTIPTTTTSEALPAYEPRVNWSAVDSAAFGISGEANDIMVAGDVVYAAGSDRSGELQVGALWRSTDGADWERVLDPAFAGDGNFWISELALYSDTFVAVGHACSADWDWDTCGPAVWVSDGGEVWERLDAGAMVVFGDDWRDLQTVTATDTGFLAGGTGIWASVDGRNWTRVYEGSSTYEIRQILFGSGQILAAGVSRSNIGDALLVRSTDGETWAKVRVPHSGLAGLLFGISETSDGFIAVGAVGPLDPGPSGGMGATDAAAWRSPDGVEWTRVEHDPRALGGAGGGWMEQVIPLDDLVISVGTMINSSWSRARGVVWESHDAGQTWDRVLGPEFGRDTGGYTSIADIEFFGGTLMAAGQQDDHPAVWIGVLGG